MQKKVEFSKQRPYHPAGVEIELSESYISVNNYGQDGSRSTIIFTEDVPAVAAAMLGVDAHYLALCVAQMKGNTVFKGSPTFERLVPALRLVSVGVVTSVV